MEVSLEGVWVEVGAGGRVNYCFRQQTKARRREPRRKWPLSSKSSDHEVISCPSLAGQSGLCKAGAATDPACLVLRGWVHLVHGGKLRAAGHCHSLPPVLPNASEKNVGC